MSDSWESFIESLEYKPNTRFRCWYDIVFNHHNLAIEMDVADVNDPSVMTTIVTRRVLPEPFDQHRAIQFVHCAIQDGEMHEVDEWFKVDGVRLFDPHAEREPNAHV